MQVKIVRMNKTERVSKNTGRPFTSLGLMTEEHGEKWLSGFAGKDTADWKVGDTVDIEVEQKGDYLNFKVPTLVKNSPSDAIVAKLENFVTFKLEPLAVKMAAAIDRLEALGGAIAVEKDDFPMPDFGEDK